MPHYMIQYGYTPDAVKTMAANPQNRFEAVRGLLEKAGGRLVDAYFALGDYDGVIIVEAPDAQTMTAVAMAAISAGHLKTFKTTPLLTAAESVSAMKKAGTLNYQAPR